MEGDWTCAACTNHNFKSRIVCNRCAGPRPPPPGPNVRSGDWMCPACSNHCYASRCLCPRCSTPKPGSACGVGWPCPKCGNHNYASRTQCNKCRGPKLGVAYPGACDFGLGRLPFLAFPSGMRPGDWVCPSCMNHNYASRQACNKCRLPKNAPHNFREGDWMCPKCGNHNYASKTACNRCKEHTVQPNVPKVCQVGTAVSLGTM